MSASVSLVGCSEPTSSSACETDDDCLAEQLCQNKQCTRRSSANNCQRDTDCPSGFKCELATGQCMQCLVDADCNGGFRCVSQRCQSNDGGTSQEDIPERNQDGALEAVFCRSDADCATDETCDVASGKCLPAQSNQCTDDAACKGEQYCVAGACVPGRRSCQANTDCNGGFDCRQGFCYPPKCQTSNDCPPGESCRSTTNVCVPTNPQDCTQSGCPQGQVCNPTTTQCETPPDCTQSGCPQGQTCNSSTKRCEPSGSDCTQSGCPQGQSCNPTTKKCETSSSSCSSDADCIPPRGTCRNGACVSCSQAGCPTNKWCNPSTGSCIDTPPSCSSNADCSPPRGTCVSGGCLSCASQFSCPSNKSCDQTTGLCVDPPCSSDLDCAPPNGTCQSGVCQSCSSGFSCPSGQTCNASTGRCVSSQPTCSSDLDCAAPNGTCRGGACVSCRTVGCPSGQSCSASTGRCSPSSSSCSSNSQCTPPSGWCRSGRCTSCLLVSCPSGQQCNRTTGVCQSSGCSSDSQCSSPNGWCRNGQCTTCRFYTCGNGLTCNYSTGRCEPRKCTSNRDCKAPRGACYNGTCQTCDGDFSCPSSQVCEPSTGLCQPKPACLKHTDCGSGKLCLGQRCVTNACDLLTSCPQGQKCQGRRCVPVYRRCYSYLCAPDDRCVTGPAKKEVCRMRCGAGGTCPSGQECLTVALQDGQTEPLCFNQPSLDAGKSCKPSDLDQRCKNNGHCLITSSFSSTGYCYDRCTPGSSQGCSSSRECVELSPGKGVCLSKGSGREGSYCRLWGSRCQASLVCLPSGSSATSGRCQKRCTAVGKAGTAGGCGAQEECVASPYSSTGGVCAPAGSRSDGYSCMLFSSYRCKVGLVCDPDPSEDTGEGLCRERCQSAANCSGSGDDCVNGVCLPKPTGSEGSTCRHRSSSSSYHCKAGLTCVYDPNSSSSYGTCKKACTSNADCTSSTYSQCDVGTCERKGTRDEHDSCSTTSSLSRCKSGLSCVRVSSFSSRCMKRCSRSSNCSSSYPECYAGFCFAKGTIKEDSYCYDSTTSRCAAPLRCARPPGSSFSSRRCLKPCTSNASCSGTNSTCKATSDGGKVCYK